MPVPKAAINKDDGFIFWKNNIRSARISLVVFSISESLGKQVFPNNLFWLGIPSLDSGHIVATLLWGMYISHVYPP